MSVLHTCAKCGHLGFSHDNWAECAECECEKFVEPPAWDSFGGEDENVKRRFAGDR